MLGRGWLEMKNGRPGIRWFLGLALVGSSLGSGCGDFFLVGPDPTLPPFTSVEEEFLQEPVTARDILWVVDNTGSMTYEAQPLAPLFNAFIASLEEYHISYQVGVITTDLGSDSTADSEDEAGGDAGLLQGMPWIITPETPNADQVFYDNVWAIVADPSSLSRERGLDAIMTALGEGATAPGTHNYGFLRKNAGLSIIAVSDSDDESDEQVAYYVSALTALKGGSAADRLIFSSIVGPEGGCFRSGNIKASEGTRYLEMTAALNGVSQSICSEDFDSVVSSVGAHQVALKREYPLSLVPVTASLTVWVDEQQAEELVDWEYDPETNALIFLPASVPDYGARIRVAYQAVREGTS